MPVLPTSYTDSLNEYGVSGRLRSGENISVARREPPEAFDEQILFRWEGDKRGWEWSTIKEANEYVAISHTWGPSESLHQGQLVNRRVLVSEWKRNHFEQWIKDNLLGVWLWLDLVCVPQEEELVAGCLQCIPYIYSRARCVHVILEDCSPLPIPDLEDLRQATQTDAANPTVNPNSILEMVAWWLRRNQFNVPNPSWLRRLWTRQEAQYATSIAFHGVCPNDMPTAPILSDELVDRHTPLGLMMRLASSMFDPSVKDHSIVETIFTELVAARGRTIGNLPGWQRQQRGGVHMAVTELRAVRRRTTRPADYVLALFPTFDWYRVPAMPRQRSLAWLLEDALLQFERVKDVTLLFPTMDGIFGSQTDMPSGGISADPRNTFDVFCCLTTIEHCARNHQGNFGAGVNECDRAVVTDWEYDTNQTNWEEQIASVCIRRELEYNSIERYAACEALEEELGPELAGYERWTLREYVLGRNPSPLATIANRYGVIEWITCIHLVISRAELRKTIQKGAKCVRARAANRHYPALVTTSDYPSGNVSIYVAPTTDLPDAGIAWLGRTTNNASCHLVGAIGGYLAPAQALRSEPRLYTDNGLWRRI